jgi:hypothetical protein
MEQISGVSQQHTRLRPEQMRRGVKMWVLVVLSISLGGMTEMGHGTHDDCVKVAKSGLTEHPNVVQKAWCIPEGDWKAGQGGVTDKNEIHS